MAIPILLTIKQLFVKKDKKSGKVLSGANLGICTTYKDEKGNYQMRVGESGFCVSANLISGKASTWTSNEKAYSVEGLVAGTYYLVEEKAPEGYDVAEPILFTLKSDGTIVDKDGKALKDIVSTLKGTCENIVVFLASADEDKITLPFSNLTCNCSPS